MKVLSVFIAVICTLLVTEECIFGQAEQGKFPVKVVVTADESIKTEIVSYVNRELRSIPDVEITYDDESTMYRIYIVAAKARAKKGYTVGLAFSVVITYEVLSGGESIEEHWVQVGPIKDLRKICEGIVATFDADVLEPVRKAIKRVLDEPKTGSESQ